MRLWLLNVIGCLSAMAEPMLTLDQIHVQPRFMAKALGFIAIDGVFTQASGSMQIDTVTRTASLEVRIALASISTGSESRDNHLRGSEFFDVANFPLATVKVQDLALDADLPRQVSGLLSLHGVSKPVQLNISALRCELARRPACQASVSTSLLRSEWGMRHYLPLVADEVGIQIEMDAAAP
ncbi:YceI family protein [Chitinimonas sp.]|uniref:YceI family protein n=1 Tax=Chitinimonas sp. TaxID=1934313 RepID=UPI0035B3B630